MFCLSIKLDCIYSYSMLLSKMNLWNDEYIISLEALEDELTSWWFVMRSKNFKSSHHTKHQNTVKIFSGDLNKKNDLKTMI